MFIVVSSTPVKNINLRTLFYFISKRYINGNIFCESYGISFRTRNTVYSVRFSFSKHVQTDVVAPLSM